MIYTDLTRLAMKLAFNAHINQVDKSGIPYIYHPIHVAEQMTDEYSTCAALLHDTIEDTDMTVDKIKGYGFPEQVIKALELLTHDNQIPYIDYVKKIKTDSIARQVKIADLKHNSDLSRFNNINEKILERSKKYQEALEVLLDD
ncbi:MAG: HD domain-containing protein [Clostridia bacterium]|nr:HD domain-containing protein [Clostridia bacterium]